MAMSMSFPISPRDIHICHSAEVRPSGAYGSSVDKGYELQHEISDFNVVCATSKALDQLVHMFSLTRVFASRLDIL